MTLGSLVWAGTSIHPASGARPGRPQLWRPQGQPAQRTTGKGLGPASALLTLPRAAWPCSGVRQDSRASQAPASATLNSVLDDPSQQRCPATLEAGPRSPVPTPPPAASPPRASRPPPQVVRKGYLAYGGCCPVSRTWRSPCSGPQVCRLFAPGGERAREGGGWEDRENKTGLLYDEHNMVRGGWTAFPVCQGARPSRRGENGAGAPPTCPKLAGSSPVTVGLQRPLPPGTGPSGKSRALCHRAGPVPLAQHRRRAATLP